VDRQRQRLVCIREDHGSQDHEAVNVLVAVDTDGKSEQSILVSGNDFYSSPRLSPDGGRLAWLTWNHPNMPWDGTELWRAHISSDGAISDARKVAGGPSESIFQPEWSPDGKLYFVSDRTGWWNVYRVQGNDIEAVTEMEAELGSPQWVFGLSRYGFEDEGRLLCTIQSGGTDTIAVVDTGTREVHPLSVPYTSVGSLRVDNHQAAFIGSSAAQSSAVALLDLTRRRSQVLRRSSDLDTDKGYVSVPDSVEFPTENGKTAHAIYYPPTNKDYEAPPGDRPPLLVLSHGGPTAATPAVFSLETLYWTSRGFAVAAVNYGGSTGYGREYRERLNGQWGVVDVDDCINCAKFLVDQGKAHPERLIVRGGSAGGYTTLCALAFRDDFKAGASYFGLSDLEPFVHDTHKFESRYLDRLVGPYPERQDLYRHRSAINHMEGFSAPVILFQGLDDKVVPPNQAEIMVEGLRRQGVPFAYVTYEGEGHGFRRAENIKNSIDSELYFYAQIFGFDLPEEVEPVTIENWQRRSA